MIRALILFYLSIKPTHGYEIQKFIQLSGTEQWMKIQSGSIYYALTKLEKEKCISVLREERTGSRVRKIYEITEHGKKEMLKEIISVLQTPIANTGSPKFIIEPMLSLLEESEVKVAIQKHIKELEEKCEYWKKWSEIKAGKDATKLIKLSFSMTIHSLEEQILWHKELLDNLELYLNEADAMKSFILQFDADSTEAETEESEVDEKINYLNKIKDIIKDDPSKALDNLDLIIDELKKEKV